MENEASHHGRRRTAVRIALGIVLTLGLLGVLGMVAFRALWLIAGGDPTHDEVVRITSPGETSLDAVLIEVSGAATVSYNRYAVFVLPKGAGSPEREDEPVLNLIGPTGSDFPYGVNLHWQSPTHLRVEYSKIRWGHGHFGTIHVNEQPVQIDVVAGVGTPDAITD